MRNRDSDYLYRFDSYFYYLTGFPEPDAVVVLVAGASPKAILFCREKHPERELWEGFRYGPEAAREVFGFDEAHPIAELDARLPQLIANQPALHYAPGMDPAWDARVMRWLNEVRALARTGVAAPAEIRDLRVALDAMRLVKDDHELARDAARGGDLRRRPRARDAGDAAGSRWSTRSRRSSSTSSAATARSSRPTGRSSPAARTPASCITARTTSRSSDGTLLLIDAGCELDGYAADITRTFPVGGRYSGPQRDIYDLVLAAQLAAIAEVRPGNPWIAPHDAAVKVLAQGFIDLGLCAGHARRGAGEAKTTSASTCIAPATGSGSTCTTPATTRRRGEWKPLRPGMTLTVEPGCYVRPAESVPERFWNIGVRIEDDALVTAAGCEILTAAAPKLVDEVEALMRDARGG